MINYNLSVRGIMAGATPFLTLIPNANRSCIIVEIEIVGMGNASAPNEAGLYLVAVAGTGVATQIPNAPASNESPNLTGSGPALAPSFIAVASYGTSQPTLGALKFNMPFNSNGSRYFWKANTNKNNAFVLPGNTLGVTIAPLSGTGAFSCRISVDDF